MDVSEEPVDSALNMQGGDIIFLLNVCAYQQDYTESHFKKHCSVKQQNKHDRLTFNMKEMCVTTRKV
jgi:hypothetical protein